MEIQPGVRTCPSIILTLKKKRWFNCEFLPPTMEVLGPVRILVGHI